MFSRINDFVENRNILVCVLIDEVESLAHARNQCLSGKIKNIKTTIVIKILTYFRYRAFGLY